MLTEGFKELIVIQFKMTIINGEGSQNLLETRINMLNTCDCFGSICVTRSVILVIITKATSTKTLFLNKKYFSNIFNPFTWSFRYNFKIVNVSVRKSDSGQPYPYFEEVQKKNDSTTTMVVHVAKQNKQFELPLPRTFDTINSHSEIINIVEKLQGNGEAG